MATYDSADLLSRCKVFARRPATDASMSDASWYQLLTAAQADAFDDLSSRAPDFFYGAPQLLTTADGGKTYTFGEDALDGTNAERPIGHVEVYPTLDAIPDYPLVPGLDFLVEGSLIRIPGNWSEVFAAGPYARLVLRPGVVSAASEPTLQPKSARMMLVYKALETYALRPGSELDPRDWEKKYDETFSRTLIAIRTAFNMAASQQKNAVMGIQPWRFS